MNELLYSNPMFKRGRTYLSLCSVHKSSRFHRILRKPAKTGLSPKTRFRFREGVASRISLALCYLETELLGSFNFREVDVNDRDREGAESRGLASVSRRN